MKESPVERVEETGSADVTALPVAPTADDFNDRTERILAMIAADPAVRDRVMVELYVQVSEFATYFRAMQDDFGKLGPGGILKMLRGKG